MSDQSQMTQQATSAEIEQALQQGRMSAGAGSTQSGATPAQGPAISGPNEVQAPLTDEHVDMLSRAAQAAHYAEVAAEDIIQVAPQYINDAKVFIAMFNQAFAIVRGLRPTR